MVLGPSLFLVYINDIADIFSTASIRNFALLYRPAADYDDMNALQEILDVLEQWAERWDMIFILDKCHVVKFGVQGFSN